MTSTSKVRKITTYSQFELAMSDSSGVVVVLYTAPGCPHCSNFLPKFNTLSIEREAANVAFYNVNLMSGDGMAIARKNNVSLLTFLHSLYRVGAVYLASALSVSDTAGPT